MFKAKSLELYGGFKHKAVLTQESAEELGLFSGDRVSLRPSSVDQKAVVCMLEVIPSSSPVKLKKTEIGISEEAFEKLRFRANHNVSLTIAEKAESLSFVHQRLELKKPYSKEELFGILTEIEEGLYSEEDLTSFILSSTLIPLTQEELVWVTEIIVSMSSVLPSSKARVKSVMYDSTQKIPGDIAPLVAIPIAAAAGVQVPYLGYNQTSVMSLFANTQLAEETLFSTLKETGAVISYGSSANIGSVLDDILCVDYSLGSKVDPFLIIGIIVRALSVGTQKVLVEIVYGLETPLKTKDDAKQISKLLLSLAKKFKVNAEVMYTNSTDVTPSGFGLTQEAKEAFKILDNTKFQSFTQRARTSELAGKLLEMGGAVRKGLGLSLSESIIDSEKALKKIEDIIRAQGSKDHKELGLKTKEVLSEQEGHLIHIHKDKLELILQALGYPFDPLAGIQLKVNIGKPVKRGDVVYELSSSSDLKLKFALAHLKEYNPFHIQ